LGVQRHRGYNQTPAERPESGLQLVEPRSVAKIEEAIHLR
jgi:hypothetical protein